MSEGRVKQSAYNMITGFLYQALTFVLSFVSRTVFIYSLGTEYLGLNGLFSDVLTLLSMADLGFGSAMAYTFYKPLSEHDEGKIASLIAFYKKVYNIIAVVVTVAGIACIPFLDKIVNTEKDIPNLEIYYLLSLAGVVISYLFVYKTTLMTADQKDYKIVKIRMWTTTLKTVLQIVVLLVSANYIAYLVIGVLTQLLNNLVASKKTEKEYPYIRKGNAAKRIDKEVQGEIIGNMKSVFIYKISGTLFNATDNLIISMVVGTAMVGIYSNYLMISNKLLLIEQIVFSSLVASIGNVIAKENAEKRLQIFQAMQSASFIFCGIISTFFCIMANDIICVWLGREYTLSVITVLAITVNTYFSCVLQPLWIYRDATGLYMKTKYIMLIGAILNIVLSFVLGRIMGISGIIFASAIARISTYFWYEPKLLFKEYFNSKAYGYYISLGKHILLMIMVNSILYKVGSYIPINNWGALIVKAAIIGSLSLLIFMFVYSKSEGFQIIWDKVREVIGKRKKKGVKK